MQNKKNNHDEIILVIDVGNTNSGYDADIQKNCTISPKSIGGSAYVDMPIEVSYSNDKTRGTVKFVDGEPTFTATPLE